MTFNKILIIFFYFRWPHDVNTCPNGISLAHAFLFLCYYFTDLFHLRKQSLKNGVDLESTAYPKYLGFTLAGAPNSAKFRGVAEGQPRFDKGEVQ